MTDLALRFIGPNDFLVVEDSHPIGRTKRASELRGEVWYWNVTIPVQAFPVVRLLALKTQRSPWLVKTKIAPI
jgi:hypothetical protein